MKTIKYKTYFIVVLFQVVFFSLTTHWADSELWGIGLSKIFYTFNHASFAYKTMFNFFLNFIYTFNLSDLNTILMARLLFSFVSFFTCILFYKFLILVTNNKKTSFIALVLFTTSTLFLTQSFKVRSDILALFFQFLGLYAFMKFKDRLNQTRLIILIILHLIMLMCTPKAVYFAVLNLLFILAQKNSVNVVFNKSINKFILFFGIVGGGYVLYKLNFLEAYFYFMEKFKIIPERPEYLSYESFYYVVEFFKKNIPFLILLPISLLFKAKDRGVNKIAIIIPALASALFLVFHNDKLPFFVFTLLPFPTIAIAVLFASSLLTEKFKKILLLGVCVNSLYWLYDLSVNGNNSLQILEQKKMLAYLEKYPGSTYYDGVVVLPKKNTVYEYPEEGKNEISNRLADMIKSSRLDIIFFSNKMFNYFDTIYSNLEQQRYIKIGNDVFASSVVYPSSHWDKLTPGAFELLCLKLQSNKNIFIYQGNNFLEMHPVGPISCQKVDLSGLFIDIKNFKYVSISKFEPYSSASNSKFAEIFDFDPEH